MLIIALAIQTAYLLYRRFVNKKRYSHRIVFYFYIKTYLIITIPVVIFAYAKGGAPQGLYILWGLGLVIYAFERINNKEEIKKYKEKPTQISFKKK
jgi:hypothetical protein